MKAGKEALPAPQAPTCKYRAVWPASLTLITFSLRSPKHHKCGSHSPGRNTHASQAGGDSSVRTVPQQPARRGAGPCSPGVEVLNVDVSVRGRFPLTPQQQTFFGRGFWNDTQGTCPRDMLTTPPTQFESPLQGGQAPHASSLLVSRAQELQPCTPRLTSDDTQGLSCRL